MHLYYNGVMLIRANAMMVRKVMPGMEMHISAGLMRSRRMHMAGSGIVGLVGTTQVKDLSCKVWLLHQDTAGIVGALT